MEHIDQIRQLRALDLFKDNVSSVSESEFREICGAQNIWHSVDLGDTFIEGARKNSEVLARECRHLDLPNVTGKTVLDVGAFSGFFSFEAERRGGIVTAIDYYSWIFDWPEIHKWMGRERAAGGTPNPYEPPIHCIDATNCPGRLVLDTTKKILGSNVKPVTTTLENFDSEPFDIVLYLGVLYHTESPLLSLKKAAQLTKELLIVETLGTHIPDQENKPLWEYYGGSQIRGDVTTNWAPNERGLKDLLLSLGFKHVEIRAGVNDLSLRARSKPSATRIWAHAYK